MDDGKKSVLFYTDWAEPLKYLSLEEKGMIFDAILSYTETGKAPSFESQAAAVAFSFIRLRLDVNIQKWDSIREKRREAGRRGADTTNRNRQMSANPANADFAGNDERQKPANPAVTVPVPVPVPVPVSSSSKPSSSDGMMTMMTPEQLWIQLGLGKQVGPGLQDLLNDCRTQGVEDAVLVEAIKRTAEYEAKAPLPYLRASLERCIAQGCKTLAQFQAGHSGAGRGLRVDRPEPSGNNFLARAMDMPLRRKRKD